MIFFLFLLPYYYHKKIKSRTVSRVLYSKRNVCHLSTTNVAICLYRSTPQHRTSNPTALIYMIFQPIRRTAGMCRHNHGRLLPCLFTLTSTNRGGYFLLRYLNFAAHFPLRRMVLCVARTFLSMKPCSGKPFYFLVCANVQNISLQAKFELRSWKFCKVSV
jgi:hypothetical protein